MKNRHQYAQINLHKKPQENRTLQQPSPSDDSLTQHMGLRVLRSGTIKISFLDTCDTLPCKDIGQSQYKDVFSGMGILILSFELFFW